MSEDRSSLIYLAELRCSAEETMATDKSETVVLFSSCYCSRSYSPAPAFANLYEQGEVPVRMARLIPV